MIISPLQLVGALRLRAPALHRALGYSFAGFCALLVVAGTVYTLAFGTVGGTVMSAAFVLYGLILGGCCAATVFYARRGDHMTHRRWALRSTVLAFGSALYRLLILPLFLSSIVGTGDLLAPSLEMMWLRAAAWLFFLPPLGALEVYLVAERRWFLPHPVVSVAAAAPQDDRAQPFTALAATGIEER